MSTLILPEPRFRASLRTAWQEFQDAGEDGATWCALERWGVAVLDDDAAFAAMCRDRRREVDEEPPPGRVRATLLWAVEGEQWLGRVQVRQALTPHLLEKGGHIGYAVRPSRRREGLATMLMAAGLRRAAEVGVASALVTCDETNAGSRTVIERAGGILEDVRGGTRRYWVPTS